MFYYSFIPTNSSVLKVELDMGMHRKPVFSAVWYKDSGEKTNVLFNYLGHDF